ncbi:acetyl-CoA carboxylase biotin carboxyl carrier protein subunit [bacterium]|nr:acetyl-CoA carboxylase biotin carboxyl carrier protein subunit [bacterium]MBU1983714.1 acetyl-CoA carboxylase biotin carboxyl carrier protein subunit [bacterium]
MKGAITVRIADRTYEVSTDDDATYVNGRSIDLEEVQLDSHCGLVFCSAGRRLRAIFDRNERESFVLFEGREYPVEIETERDRLLKQFEGMSHTSHQHAEIRASMPGLVARVAASIGDTVTKGEPLLILEAMKMENEIRSPADGLIKEIHVKQGRTVEKGDLLIVLD